MKKEGLPWGKWAWVQELGAVGGTAWTSSEISLKLVKRFTLALDGVQRAKEQTV